MAAMDETTKLAHVKFSMQSPSKQRKTSLRSSPSKHHLIRKSSPNAPLTGQCTDHQKLPPNDRCYVHYWVCLLLGCGVLLAYNLLITCADYFTAELPNYPNIMFYVVPASSITQMIFLVVMVLYGHRASFTKRIVYAFVLSSIGTAMAPIFVQEFDETTAFWALLLISAFTGMTTAVLQASVVGLVNFFPSAYIQVSFAGQAVSGISACVIRIITKLFDIYGGISAEQGGVIYFVTGAAFNIVCALAFSYLIKSSWTQFYLTRLHELETDALIAAVLSPGIKESYSSARSVLSPSDSSIVRTPSYGSSSRASIESAPDPSAHSKHPSYVSVLKKIWKTALAVFLVFFVTLLIYPGLLVGIHSQFDSVQTDEWLPVILTTEYNIGDWAGRQFLVSWLRKMKWNQDSLLKGCFARLVMYPVFVLLFVGYFQYDAITLSATAILSLSNGYFCCLCFIQAPKLVRAHEQQVCGAIMTFALCLGIVIGSYTALVLSPYLVANSAKSYL